MPSWNTAFDRLPQDDELVRLDVLINAAVRLIPLTTYRALVDNGAYNGVKGVVWRNSME